MLVSSVTHKSDVLSLVVRRNVKTTDIVLNLTDHSVVIEDVLALSKKSCAGNWRFCSKISFRSGVRGYLMIFNSTSQSKKGLLVLSTNRKSNVFHVFNCKENICISRKN